MTTSAVQTTVPANAPIGLPGDPYPSEEGTVVTKIALEVIPFGVWVSFNTEGKADLPDSTGEVTGVYGGGVALRGKDMPSGSTGYAIGDAVPVMTRGKVFVLCEETLVVGDTPFARFASGGGGTQLGAFRNDADTATAVAAPNTRFYAGGGTTSPAVLELF
jgi:hypothetical protein